MNKLSIVSVFALACSVFASAPAAAAEWNPAAWAGEDVLDFRTIAEGEKEHWSRVWLVVIDDELYIRLGTRAAERIETNLESPYVGIRIAGEEFAGIEAVPVPDMAESVAEAMGEKYWSDVFIKYFAHPLTMRLVERTGPDQGEME